jgi:hypothetical protein
MARISVSAAVVLLSEVVVRLSAADFRLSAVFVGAKLLCFGVFFYGF